MSGSNIIFLTENVKGFVIATLTTIIEILLCIFVSDSTILTISILIMALGACLMAVFAYMRYHDIELCCRVLCSQDNYIDSNSSISVDVPTDNDSDSDHIEVSVLVD